MGYGSSVCSASSTSSSTFETQTFKKATQTSGESKTSCPLGSSQSYDKTSCIPCAPGYYVSSSGVSCSSPDNSMSSCCYKCPDGTICPGFGTYKPVYCPAGYSANYRKTECLRAPPGYYSGREGFYCDHPEETPLSCFYKCPAGKVCPCTGTSEPILCQPGTASNFERTECIKATPGYYSGTAGYYCDQPSNSGLACFSYCPNGKICPGSGTYNPIACPAGYSANYRKTECLRAPPGYYSGREGFYCDHPEETPLSCFYKCPAGKICPGLGTYEPILCQAGTASNYERTQCLIAPPGYYAGREGFYCEHPEETPLSCFYKCSTGHICPGSGTSQPIPCPSGTKPDSASISCVNISNAI